MTNIFSPPNPDQSQFLQALLDGRLFTGNTSISVANGASLDLLVRVGAKKIFLRASASVVGDSTVQFFEGTDVNTEGVALPDFDVNRDTANTPVTTLFTGPTFGGGGIGTQLGGDTEILAGQRNSAVTEQISGDGTLLNENTDYTLRITNNSGSASITNIAASFLEEA